MQLFWFSFILKPSIEGCSLLALHCKQFIPWQGKDNRLPVRQLLSVARRRSGFSRRSSPSSMERTTTDAWLNRAAHIPSRSRTAIDSWAASNICISLKPLPRQATPPSSPFTISSLHPAAPSRGKVLTVMPKGPHSLSPVRTVILPM